MNHSHLYKQSFMYNNKNMYQNISYPGLSEALVSPQRFALLGVGDNHEPNPEG